MADKPQNPVKSVRKTLEIIDIIQERDEVGVTELADELDMNKGTVHSHLATLAEEGYVVNEDGRYRLGLKFIDIAHRICRREEIYDIVEEEVDKLAAESGELVLFTVEEQHEGICLYKASGSDAVQTELYVGYRNSLHHTAVGKAILAFKSEAEIDEIIEATDLKPHTENTITDPDVLREELAEIRERGVAYNRSETIPGLTGVGAPIRKLDRGVYGAIAVIGPSSRMTEERLSELANLIDGAVNVIEITATSM